MLLSRDPVSAFMTYDPVPVDNAATGPLAGLTMAVKDLYDVAGYPTGRGTPAWLDEHPEPATATAPPVQACLNAGARFVGKTITDELAFSLNGKNAHYGTPVNTRAPDRIPGGSSSGSASAVAAGLCDFAFGSDTGGSIRAPASYNGLYGLRPTFGRISLEHCAPLAESFDTVGWFARDLAVFARVADVVLGPDSVALSEQLTVKIVAETMDRLMPGRAESLAPAFERVTEALGPTETIDLTADGLGDWLMAFRHIQGVEAWAAHGAWITEANPALGPGVKERFLFAREVDPAEAEAAWVLRREMTARLDALLGSNTLLLLPTVPDIAPLIKMPHEALETYRNLALSFLCISGLSGLPQLSLPLAESDGAPLGVSLIGPRGSDRALIRLAAQICGL